MNIDDPRLTAYALDECEHLEAEDRAEIEKALAADAKLSAEVAELRRLTQNLREELHAEKGEALTPEQRAEVLTALNGNGNQRVIVPTRHRWWRSQMIGLAVAACVVIGLSATIYYQGEHVRLLEVQRDRLVAAAAPKEAGVPVQLHEFGENGVDLAEDAAAPAPHLPKLEVADPAGTSASFAIDSIGKAPEQAKGGSNAPGSASTTWAAQSGAINLTTGVVPAPEVSTALRPAAAAPLSSLESRPDAPVADGARVQAADFYSVAPGQAPARPVRLYAAPPAPTASTASTPTTAGRATSARGLMLGDGTVANYEYGLTKQAGDGLGYKVDEGKVKLGATAGGLEKMPYYRGRGIEETGRTTVSPAKREPGKVAYSDEVPGALSPGVASEPVQLKRQLVEAEKELKERAMTLAKRTESDSKLEGLAETAPKAAADTVEVEVLGRRVEQLRQQIQQHQDGESNTEAYDSIKDNPFLTVVENPLSTFSIDVDTASYSNVRRFLNSNQRPPKGAVRVEELVNYFRYDYPQPKEKDPFGATMEVATCPWAPEHRLVRVGIKGREIPRNERPPANLVFLVDVSGSMQPENKLPLVKDCLRLLTDQLGADDSVAIAVYAGASGCVLEPTHDKDKVRTALTKLESGGSTNGAAGIQLAYDLAQRAFKKGGSNRVILCTDGDFNVGTTDQSQLVSMIESKAKTGVFLSVLGFGYGNLKDSTLEKLADKGNGYYGYIDSIGEGRRLFVEQLAGTLCTIAKDVKIQVEFNPAQVGSYRLIGYENRLLAKEDFNDDTKDAGEIGAGHTVTALYEVVPAGQVAPTVVAVDELKYQPIKAKRDLSVTEPESSKELLTVKVRYKQPEGDTSTKVEFPLRDSGLTWEKSSRDFRWAAAVAGFGMMLRDSPHKGSLSWSLVEELTSEGRSENGNAERAEFVQLVDKARALAR